MNRFDINIHRFANKFSDVYDFLYTHHDKVAAFGFCIMYEIGKSVC